MAGRIYNQTSQPPKRNPTWEMAGTGALLDRQYHSAFPFHHRSLEVQPDHLPDGSFSPSIDCILSGVCACPDTKRKAKRRHCRMAVSPYPHFSPSGFASCIVADVSISLRSRASTDYGRKMVHTGILVWTWRNLYHRLCSSHSKTSAWRRAFHDRSVTPVGGRTDGVCR